MELIVYNKEGGIFFLNLIVLYFIEYNVYVLLYILFI